MVSRFVIILLFFSVYSCVEKAPRINKIKKTHYQLDSLFSILGNSSQSDSLKTNSLKRIELLISNLENDSLKINSTLKLAYNYLVNGNLKKFKYLNLVVLKNPSINKDTLSCALVNEYLGYYYQLNYQPDSAFYYYNQTLRFKKGEGNEFERARLYLSLATIQINEKDYTGSEINSIKAISKLKNSEKFRSLYLAFNNLAAVSNQLKKYDKSIDYRKKGLEYLKKLKNANKLKLLALNGIGISYQEKGDYNNSIKYFNNALNKKNTYKLYPVIYAVLIDNLAYSKFLKGDNSQLPKLFFKSLKIRDSLNIIDGIIINNLHLAEYYIKQGDSLKATQHSLKAKKLSKTSTNNRDLLESYLLLSKLEHGDKGKKYLNKYIKLSDSLQQQERAIREKFTRIAYETDEIINEKEAETKKKWQIILFSGVGAGFSILFFIYLRQRSRNKELVFIQDQDKANVEIYNLMLSQQKMFNEGSAKEKKRISKELHDDILGRLFGARLSLDAINESKEEEDIADREKSIEELQMIEEDIRKISHNLSSSQFSENMSFATLVDQLLLKQSKITKFKYELSFSNNLNLENISNTIKINCYRVLQESIQNINKYAKASNVKINFSEENGSLLFNIEDNGIGFNIKNTKKGIGIKNIRSRVKDLKGQVKFISKPENGTKIQVKIPIQIELK